MVRLKGGVTDINITQDKIFQFLMVRLKEDYSPAPSSAMQLFQFLMVRLKVSAIQHTI